MISIHPSDTNLDPILDIIGNKLAMEINQAWDGHPGGLVKTLPPSAPPAPPVTVSTSRTYAVCLSVVVRVLAAADGC